jgi:putative glutamine amidotransferase
VAKAPLIGVTADWKEENGQLYLRVDRGVLEWLKDEGMTPVVFPSFPGSEEHLLDSVSGLVIPGGRDIAPEFYSGVPEKDFEEDNCHKDRTAFEIALLWRAARLNIPVLGICLGCQVINVAFNGDLIPHLDDPKGRHRRKNSKKTVNHRVHPVEGSFIENMEITKDTRVSSSHHQAVGKVAPGWKVTAYGPDRVIEIIESDEYPLVKGIQWHPERTPHSPLSKSLALWLKKKALDRKSS